MITEITLSPTDVPSSPGWHTKYNWRTYVVQKTIIFDKKSNFGARLDEFRLPCFVMNLWSQSLLILNGNS